ncbi:polysaccharide biosynthesis tyrosine autokinase [Nostocaceae cyanobacterium CENA357]|uniref:Polysaccharide biosynthesis tyrosine autokinase n=1 Tax=Atlanticothrix silvestris CENA357 TaxID=1725252 RepID=A0A8J7KY44_9CYAN|nr:polysaccharide biosynthesis tyrosine autokinase [Atlanticothrix silvestris]MBH8551109.1 polysaccharide biosynthesis tyrosine autokinase [Atlanticothrix silvestris CENA357]
MVANTNLNQERLVTNSSTRATGIKKLSTILIRQRFLILGISCLVMSIASLLAVNNKPDYQSYMQILVKSNLYEEPQSNEIEKDTNSGLTDFNLQGVDYNAQMKLMLSSKLINQAVDLLRPYYPNITSKNIKGRTEDGKKPPLEVTKLEDRKEVNQFSSQVFEISFNDADPVKAQRVLQALQKVYQEYNIEQQKERLKKGLAFFNARLPKVKKDLSQAEINLEKFRKKHNLLDPEVQSKILLESLADIQNQLQNTRAQLQDVQARYSSLEQKMAVSSQNAAISASLSQSPRYQSLLNEVQKTELALAKERLRYTDESPKIEVLEQQRQSQLKLLRREVERSLSDKTIKNSSNIESPLTTKQIVGVDPPLLQELIQLQTASLGLIANEKSLAESEQRIRSELSKYPSLIAEYNRLLPEVENHRKTLEQLLQTQQSLGLKIAQGGFDWQVLEEPHLQPSANDNRLLLLVGGLVIGPLLGVAVALTWGMFNRTIGSVQELQQLTNLRLLGLIPKLAPHNTKKRLPSLSMNGRRNLAPSLVETNTWLPCHETLDMVYQNIQILNYPFPCKSLMLTSAQTGEGKTTLALGLAASAAHMHRRVLLIDGNLRHPHLHKTLNLSNDWGLSLLLVDETNTDAQDYIQPIHPAIDILTAGPTPEDTVKLLSSQRMTELIKFFEQIYDLVLIDAPSILGTVDARILAALCNGIIMVGRIGQVSQAELIQATGILSQLNLIGIVANEVSNVQIGARG